MKAVKIIVDDKGQMMAKPCDVDEEDAAEARPFDSLESIMAAVPGMLEESAKMKDDDKGEMPGKYPVERGEKPMMEGEEAFVSGFRDANGKNGGY